MLGEVAPVPVHILKVFGWVEVRALWKPCLHGAHCQFCKWSERMCRPPDGASLFFPLPYLIGWGFVAFKSHKWSEQWNLSNLTIVSVWPFCVFWFPKTPVTNNPSRTFPSCVKTVYHLKSLGLLSYIHVTVMSMPPFFSPSPSFSVDMWTTSCHCVGKE